MTTSSPDNDTIVLYRQPCPSCSSSDAYHVWADGHGYCFSCNTLTKASYHSVTDETQVAYTHLAWRDVTAETMETYGVLTKLTSEGEPVSIGFPYGEETFKVRSLKEKEFKFVGDTKQADPLFGMRRWSKGSAKCVLITEGEMDAMSAYQMLDRKWPCLSIKGASSARKDCTQARDYLNSFERIYLCFDRDEPGQKAVQQVAGLFDFNKVYHVDLSRFKDANEYLTNGAIKEFQNVVFNARRIMPTNIISSFEEMDKILEAASEKPSIPFPFPTLQSITEGIRTGESYLVKAPEGIGKTEFIRALEYHVLQTTDDNIGIIHLEESKDRLLKGLAGLHLNKPAHLRSRPVPLEEVKQAYREVIKREDRVFIYSHFGSSDPDVILDTIRFMVSACGCKYVFLDHITMVVTGLNEDKERQTLDYISTRLGMMTEELDFALIFISHINDDGKTRGSRNISKIAHTIISISRDHLNEDPKVRNTTNVVVEKNRFASKTGPAGKLYFNPETFTMREIQDFELEMPPVNPTESERCPANPTTQ